MEVSLPLPQSHAREYPNSASNCLSACDIEGLEIENTMKRSRLNTVPSVSSAFILAALLCGSVWGAAPPQPGSINYLEGQASIDGQALTQSAVGSAALAAGQLLATQEGRAELLLTPGIFFRIANQSAVQMVSTGLVNTVVTLQRGRALVEVADILPANNVVINQVGASTRILKSGLYEFDADRGVVRVFDGKASVRITSGTSGRAVDVKSGRQVIVNGSVEIRAQNFDKKGQQDDFYRWASLRSSYLTEANVDAARRYVGVGGYAPDLWSGANWYWDPWFDAYTFIPDDGIFFSPFGWGFYSPWLAFGAFGYGGYGGGYYHHFGPGYHPGFLPGGGPGFNGSTYSGHAYRYGGNSFNSRGFGGSGFRSGSTGFQGGGFGGMRGGGGGFHGGGGGGFHGGGGGGRR